MSVGDIALCNAPLNDFLKPTLSISHTLFPVFPYFLPSTYAILTKQRSMNRLFSCPVRRPTPTLRIRQGGLNETPT